MTIKTAFEKQPLMLIKEKDITSYQKLLLLIKQARL